MTTTVNFKAAEGFVLCWIPETLRPIDILADWNDLKAQLAAGDERPDFPNRVAFAQPDEYCDIPPSQAQELLSAWHEAHPEPEEPEPDESAEPAPDESEEPINEEEGGEV